MIKKISNLLKALKIQLLPKRYRAPYKIESGYHLEVGKLSFHNGNLDIRGDQKVSIGSYCAFGKNISIITSNHDYNFTCLQGTFYHHYFKTDHPGVKQFPPNRERTKGKVEIGSDVWIADNVTILSGVKIGNGACIGNNSIVTKDVSAYSIVAGIPAKEIKKRFDSEKIVFLEQLEWWTWTEERIRHNQPFFNCDLNKTSLVEIKKMIQ